MVEPFRSPMDVKDLLSLLETVKQSGNGWTARCPAHDDRKPSLSVGVGTDGRILVHCHAGCEIEAICRELEIEQRDLFPATTDHGHSPRQEPSVVYDYDNLFQVLRYPGKKFLQRRPDGNDGWIWDTQGVKPRLYHLNDLAGHKQVIVAEGEKDVDRLRQLGLAATCNSGGAGKWQAAHAEQLRGVEVQRVVVIPDGDDAGRKHGLTVARTCAAAGLTVNWSCPSSVDTYPLGEEEESTMPKSRPPYPAAFRQQMVELVRSGRTPGELAREFEPSAEAIRNWAAQADRDAGKRSDGLRTEEHEEIRRLRRENRQLREEREILAKATAWFARETGPGRSTGS